MSLTNFDINFGFNGEPTTASASFIQKSKLCGDPQITPDKGSLGDTLNTGRKEIDDIISDFVIVQKTTSKESGFKKISYEMVDRQAKRLESIAVLVRGITAPSTQSLTNSLNQDFKRIYSFAETTLAADLKIGEFGLTSVDKITDTLYVIGRTFSVVSADWEEFHGTNYYAGGTVVGQTPKGEFPNIIKNLISYNQFNATLKYGYYLSDLKKLVITAGYSIQGFPEDSNFVTMDFGGSLKEILSSVASLYGLYFIVRGNTIRFFGNSNLSSLEIPNFVEDTDANIISANHSLDFSGRSSVGVIRGSESPKTPETTESNGGRNRQLRFFNLSLDKLFFNNESDKIRFLMGLFTFFLWSGDKDAFDAIITTLMTEKKDVIKGEDFKKLYGEDATSFEKVEKKDMAKTKEIDEIIANNLHFDKYDNYYKVNNGLPMMEMPSNTKLYTVLKNGIASYGSIYISNPVSKNFSENYELSSANGYNVIGPYIDSTKISDIPELDAAKLFLEDVCGEKVIEDVTLKDFFQKAKTVEGTPVIKIGYHWIAIKDILFDSNIENSKRKKQIRNDQVEENKKAVSEAISEKAGKHYNHNGETNYFFNSKEGATKIDLMTSKSASFFKEISKIKKQIKVPCLKKIDDDDDDNDGIELPDSEYVSFKIRDSSTDLSSVNVVLFEGTNDEAAHISSNFNRIFSPSFKPESSSVTYSGMKDFDIFNPALSSVSYTFSENGVDTSLSFSNKEFAAQDESIIMGSFSVNSSVQFAKSLKTRQKNFLGVY